MKLTVETRRARPRRNHWLSGTALGAASLVALASAPAVAAITGGSVVAGSASIDTANPAAVTITQTTQKAVINWSTFSNAQNETVTFNQPIGPGSITLNRVTGTQGSVINGAIAASNGQVWLLNPNGVTIGPTGSVNVRGFVASTHDLVDNATFDSFMASSGNYTFADTAVSLVPGGGYGFAEVINQGMITVGSGYAILAGREVRNAANGAVFADLGSVVLAGAPTLTVSLAGDSLLSFTVSGEFTQLSESGPGSSVPLVDNVGSINARGGKILVSTRAASNIVANVVNLGGNVDANAARFDANGMLVLSGGTPSAAGVVKVDGGAAGIVQVSGSVHADNGLGGTAGSIEVAGDSVRLPVGGQLLANAQAAGGVGGTVKIGADAILIVGNGVSNESPPTISAGGTAAAGSVSIGGELGGGPVLGRSAGAVEIQGAAAIFAEVFGSSGTGGNISIWSDPMLEGSTTVRGRVSARGSGGVGNGGTVEIGGGAVDILGDARIDVGSNSIGGTIRVIGDILTLDTAASTAPAPKGLLAAGLGGGGTISIGGGSGGTLLAGRPLAHRITIGQTTRLNANAASSTQPGAGGTISVWTDRLDEQAYTRFETGSATALAAGTGSGGLIEIGGFNVGASGFGASNAQSLNGGAYGRLRIVGTNITVREAPNLGEVPEMGRSLISNADIASVLATGTIVELKADSVSDSEAGQVLVEAAIGTPGNSAKFLELTAGNDVVVANNLTADSMSSGTLNLLVKAGHQITLGDGTNAGTISTNGGNVDLILGGIGGPLANDAIRNRANFTIETDGGDLRVESEYDGLSPGAVLLENDGSILSNGGTITFVGGDYNSFQNDGIIDASFDSLGGNIAVTLGFEGSLMLGMGSQTRTQGLGTINLAVGDGAELRNEGTVSSEDGAIGLQVGNGNPQATIFSEIRNLGTFETVSGAIQVTLGFGASLNRNDEAGNFSTLGGDLLINGGPGADINLSGFNSIGGDLIVNADLGSSVDLGGTFMTNGGGVAITAFDGDVSLDGMINTGVGGNSSGGSLSVNVGSQGFLSASGQIDTYGGGVTLTGGDGATLNAGGSIFTGGGDFLVSLGNGIDSGEGIFGGDIGLFGTIDTGGGDFTVSGGELTTLEVNGSLLTHDGAFSAILGAGSAINVGYGFIG
ncbi:MAG: filamentous hemagglutinin N-terminal domain-containing protein, partial [Sphingomonadaceae bacterium]|nr:filamentous hemagglutinin N-terminal domain-containing protein [Sphingomonadaceae bacterium]